MGSKTTRAMAFFQGLNCWTCRKWMKWASGSPGTHFFFPPRCGLWKNATVDSPEIRRSRTWPRKRSRNLPWKASPWVWACWPSATWIQLDGPQTTSNLTATSKPAPAQAACRLRCPPYLHKDPAKQDADQSWLFGCIWRNKYHWYIGIYIYID